MASRELNILVAAKGALKAARDIGTVNSKVKGLSASAGRAGKVLGVGLVAGAGAGILLLQRNVDAGIASLRELEQMELATAAVIESTGGKAGVTAKQVRKLAEEQENLTTVDDKTVQAGQNMLLTFTGIGGDVFPMATKAMVDMGVAMNNGSAEGLDLSKTAILIGKALNDPIKGVTALRKNGVALTEQQQKDIKSLVKQGKMREAQLIILKELGVEFGKAGEAAGKGAGAVERRFSDAVEGAQMALSEGLIPVIAEVQKEVTGLLADQGNLDAIKGFGQGLAGAFREGVTFAKQIPWGSIADAMKLAGTGAKAALDLFTGLPPWVQTAVVTGWGLNKLTGGAVGSIVGELGKGLIKGVLGMNAGVVNINAGAVNGMPGGAGGKGGLGIGGAIMASLTGAAILGIGYAVGSAVVDALGGPLTDKEKGGGRTIGNVAGVDVVMGQHYGAQVRGANKSQAAPFVPGRSGGRSPEEREGRRTAGEAAVLERATAKGLKPSADQITRTYNATTARQAEAARSIAVASMLNKVATDRSADRIVAAINAQGRPQVSVNVTAADTVQAIVRRRRIVKPGGPRRSGPLE
jgi:hypothetical protein